MSRGTNCFDLFDTFSGAVGLSGKRTGNAASEFAQSIVWLAFVNEHRDQMRKGVAGQQTVKKSQPVVAKELLIVKSCKRKVRW